MPPQHGAAQRWRTRTAGILNSGFLSAASVTGTRIESTIRHKAPDCMAWQQTCHDPSVTSPNLTVTVGRSRPHRVRWRSEAEVHITAKVTFVENGTTYCLARHGCHFELGSDGLASLLVAINLLAFAFHSVPGSLRGLWHQLRNCFDNLRVTGRLLVFPHRTTLFQILLKKRPTPARCSHHPAAPPYQPLRAAARHCGGTRLRAIPPRRPQRETGTNRHTATASKTGTHAHDAQRIRHSENCRQSPGGIHLNGCMLHTMRTNVVLDDALVRQAMELTGTRTKREVIHLALAKLVERKTRLNLLELAGEIDFADDFDYKALRQM